MSHAVDAFRYAILEQVINDRTTKPDQPPVNNIFFGHSFVSNGHLDEPITEDAEFEIIEPKQLGNG